MLRLNKSFFMNKLTTSFNKNPNRFFNQTTTINVSKIKTPFNKKKNKMKKKITTNMKDKSDAVVVKPLFNFNAKAYNSVLKDMNNMVNTNALSNETTVALSKSATATVTQANNLINPVDYALLNPVNKTMKFNFILGSLMYWGVPFNYTVATKFFLAQKVEQKRLEGAHMHYNSEMLLRYTKRNAQVIIHMPRIPSLVFKKYLLHRELVRQWNNDNSSDMLFGFSTGDCGFKPNETKTFIAKDTLVRAGLWIITRFVKKLSPIKLRFQGDTTTFRQYLNRLTPKTKKFKYFVSNIEDSTAISFNGCKLRHAPRKRFRYHTNNFRNLVSYIKNFKDLKPQGMSSYKKYF